jgi:urease accessory protein
MTQIAMATLTHDEQPTSPTWEGRIAGALGALAGLGTAFPALAHPGHGPHDLAAGLAHPLTGVDHLLAMVAVGLWAALRGDKALWAWPLAFVGAMLAGYGLGQAGLHHSLIEPAILASVIVLGALVAANACVPTLVGMAIIASFGLAHGLAHGAEAPAGAGPSFPLGFAASTAVLHLAGLGVGLVLTRLKQPIMMRTLGLGAAVGGVLLVFAS